MDSCVGCFRASAGRDSHHVMSALVKTRSWDPKRCIGSCLCPRSTRGVPSFSTWSCTGRWVSGTQASSPSPPPLAHFPIAIEERCSCPYFPCYVHYLLPVQYMDWKSWSCDLGNTFWFSVRKRASFARADHLNVQCWKRLPHTWAFFGQLVNDGYAARVHFRIYDSSGDHPVLSWICHNYAMQKKKKYCGHPDGFTNIIRIRTVKM